MPLIPPSPNNLARVLDCNTIIPISPFQLELKSTHFIICLVYLSFVNSYLCNLCNQMSIVLQNMLYFQIIAYLNKAKNNNNKE